MDETNFGQLMTVLVVLALVGSLYVMYRLARYKRRMTDAEIVAVRKRTTTNGDYTPWSDAKAFANNVIDEFCKKNGIRVERKN